MSMSARRPGARDPSASTNPLVPALACFKLAAVHLGASSSAALRRRFERGVYPGRFIIRLTPTRPGVDLHALLAWIRRGGRDTDELRMESTAQTK